MSKGVVPSLKLPVTKAAAPSKPKGHSHSHSQHSDEDDASFSSDADLTGSDLDEAHSGVDSDDLSDLWEAEDWQPRKPAGVSKIALIRPLALVTAQNQPKKQAVAVPPLDFSQLLGDKPKQSQKASKPTVPALPLAQLNKPAAPKPVVPALQIKQAPSKPPAPQIPALKIASLQPQGPAYKAPLAPITQSDLAAGKQLHKVKAESGVLDSPASSSDLESGVEKDAEPVHQFDSEEEDEAFYAEVARTAADIAQARQQGMVASNSTTVNALGAKVQVAKDSKMALPKVAISEATVSSARSDLDSDEDTPHSFGSKNSVTRSANEQAQPAGADAKGTTPKRPISPRAAPQDDDRLCSRTCASGTRRCVIM